MLRQNGYRTKTNRNFIHKAIYRNQKPDAKLHSNQQQSMRHCVFFLNCSLLNCISMQIEKEIGRGLANGTFAVLFFPREWSRRYE